MRLSDKILTDSIRGVHKPSTLSDALLDLKDARLLLKQIIKSPAFFKSNYVFPYTRREKVLECLGVKSTARECLECEGKGFNYHYTDHAHLPGKPQCEGCKGTGRMRISLAAEDKEVITVSKQHCPDCKGRLEQIAKWQSIDEDLECNRCDHTFFLIRSQKDAKMIKKR